MPDAITGDRPELKPVNIGAAAIDIGSKMHMAAVDPTCTDVPVRAFGTFTQDLHDLVDWFKACGVTSVAMESTGVYWIPAYEILEQHGFEVSGQCALRQERAWAQNRCQRCRMAAPTSFLRPATRQLPT
jgi:transposase